MNALKKLVSCAVFALALMNVNANEVLKEGFKAGQWTQDYDAALAAAKKGGIPLLLNFTGSDWCGWCKKMDAGVFSKPEWSKYAEGNVALAFIDFPRDKSKVPENFVARNKELAKKYGVRGYPTYILLDSETGTELGRLNAQDNTPAKFIGKVNELRQFAAANLKKVAATNPAIKTAADAYAVAKTELESLKEKLEAAQKNLEAAQEKQKGLRLQLEDLFAEAKAKEMGDRGPAYLAARKELKAVKKEMADWMGTRPSRSPENMKKYQDFQSRLNEAMKKLSEF